MPSATQLLYSLTTNPFPLQASPAEGTLNECVLTVLASNPAPDPAQNQVTLAGVQITVPIGDAAAELTPDVAGVVPVPPSDAWTLAKNTAAGVYVFVPVGPPGTTVQVGSQALEFRLEAVRVNRVPGPVAGLELTEGTSGNPTIDLPLTKFPSGWGAVAFWAHPPDIDFRQSTTLHWSGPPGATYEIQYATQGGVVNLPPTGEVFANAGEWPGADDPPLVLDETTVFTMEVTDEQYTSHVQTTVTVVPPGPQITEFAGTIELGQAGYEALLGWTTANADYCTLSVDVQELEPDAAGVPVAIAPPFSGTYVLEAVRGDASASATLQAAWSVRSVTALPAGCDPPADLALSPDGSLLYVAGGDSLAVYETPAAPDGPLAAAFVEGGMHWAGMPVGLAACGSSSGQLVWAWWSYAPGQSVARLFEVGDGQVNQLAIAPIEASATANAVAATPDGAQVYVVTGGTLWAFEYSPGTGLSAPGIWGIDPVTALAASEDGRLYEGTAGAVEVAEVTDSGPSTLTTMPLPGQTVGDLAIAGELLFAALGQEVVLADRLTAQQIGPPLPVAADRIAVSPDGLRLYALVISAQSVYVLSPTPLIQG